MRTYSVSELPLDRRTDGRIRRKETVGRAAAGVVVVVPCPGNSILASLLAKNDSCSMSRTLLLLHPHNQPVAPSRQTDRQADGSPSYYDAVLHFA